MSARDTQNRLSIFKMETVATTSRHQLCVAAEEDPPLCPVQGPGSCRVHSRAPWADPPHPQGLPGWWEGEAGRKARVCLVDCVEFREGFPFDLAKEKSSLFPPASGPASPMAEGAGFPPFPAFHTVTCRVQ